MSPRIPCEDFTDDLGLSLIHLVLHTHAPPFLYDSSVVVPVASATNIRPHLRLVLQVFARSLSSLFALQLRGKKTCRHHELTHGTVDKHLLFREVIEEPSPRVEQILNYQGCPVLISPQPRLVPAHHDLELIVLGRVQHRDQSGSLLEFSSADGVVHVNMLLGKAPALGPNESFSFRALQFERQILVQFGAAACVDSGFHHDGRLLPDRNRSATTRSARALTKFNSSRSRRRFLLTFSKTGPGHSCLTTASTISSPVKPPVAFDLSPPAGALPLPISNLPTPAVLLKLRSRLFNLYRLHPFNAP